MKKGKEAKLRYGNLTEEEKEQRKKEKQLRSINEEKSLQSRDRGNSEEDLKFSLAG